MTDVMRICLEVAEYFYELHFISLYTSPLNIVWCCSLLIKYAINKEKSEELEIQAHLQIENVCMKLDGIHKNRSF